MKKTIALFVMTLTASVNAAEWINIPDSQKKDYKLYADVSSIKYVNGYFRVWMMYSYNKNQKLPDAGFEFKSSLALMEMDCKEGRVRFLSVQMNSDEMARGSVVASDTNIDSKWDFVVPGSVGDNIYSLTCTPSKSK